jgi:hypothetical protein
LAYSQSPNADTWSFREIETGEELRVKVQGNLNSSAGNIILDAWIKPDHQYDVKKEPICFLAESGKLNGCSVDRKLLHPINPGETKMKRISQALICAIPCIAIVAPGHAQQTAQPSLESMKAKISAISNGGLSLLSQSKNCFAKVQNESSFNQCVTAMPEKLKPEIFRLFSTSNNVLNLQSASERKLTYSQSNNQKIVDHLSSSMNAITAMQICIDGSTDTNQLLSCVQKKPTQNLSQQNTNANTSTTGNLSEDW